uniref:Uncharacterized protein n=1 Tax=Strongyloides venezuelensis TaxID=75913 RepID=A0A0K0FQ79_STRVS
MNNILYSSFVLLLAPLLINGFPNQLINIACERNPSLSMCYRRNSNMRDDPFPSNSNRRHFAPPPSRFFGRLQDQPIFNDKDILPQNVPVLTSNIPVSALPAAVVATCTPDCTALHCTNECKCAHTHKVVHLQCNPPANAHIADHCQSWYRKCPMFHPIQY